MSLWPGLTAPMTGELVLVEPLRAEHEDGLFAAGADPEIWTYLTSFPDAAASRERFHEWMLAALAATEAGLEGAWTVLDRASGRPIGSTRYLALRPEHASLEIGWTWLGRAWWGSGANVETKLLLLGRAFEQLGCARVELKTDARNARSRAAMAAVGARFEGVHRHHMALPDGTRRDTAWYSVIAPEWPAVRAALRARVARHAGRTANEGVAGRDHCGDVLTGPALPPGYGSVNPFVAVRGPGGATAFIAFLEAVLGGRETRAAHTVDADGLLIHAEVRVGDATVMLCDAKPHWAFTPALLQVYVAELEPVATRARSRGAEVVTEPTAFHGGQRLARLRDPWQNLWWLFEYGPGSTAPSEGPDELPRWRPDPAAPPSYVHRTVDAALTDLGPPPGEER